MIRSSLTYIRLLTEMLRSSRKSGASCAQRIYFRLAQRLSIRH